MNHEVLNRLMDGMEKHWIAVLVFLLLYGFLLAVPMWLMRQRLKRRAEMYEAALCDDEGCPQHGTPHVCIDTSKLRPTTVAGRLMGFVPDMSLLQHLVTDYERLRKLEQSGKLPKKVPDELQAHMVLDLGGSCQIMVTGGMYDLHVLENWIESSKGVREIVEKVEADNPGWVIKDSQDVTFRSMESGDIDWTPSQEHALRFARREDAENFAHHDEDAWRIKPYEPPPKTEGFPA